MERVLVIQTAFIGDAILGTALLEKAHLEHPQAKIDYLVRKGNESLFQNHPFIHKLLVWDKDHAKYQDLFRLIRVVRKERYDLVLNIQRYAASGILTALSKAERTVGYQNNPFSFLFSKAVKHRFGAGFEQVHEVDRVLDLWGSSDRDVLPKLYPSKADIEKVAKLSTQTFVTIAPASVWFTKQLPVDKWIELINSIPTDLKVFLIGGKSDRIISDQIIASVSREVTDLSGQLNLLETAALMKSARMNYANDSAPVHLASAMNAPICEVFCSTVPTFGFTPLSENAHIVETKEDMSCRPCGIHGRAACPQGHFNCARSIDVQEMLAILV